MIQMTIQQYTGPPMPVQDPQLQLVQQGLSALVHGGPKVGKSTFAASVPAPRLILDAESGSAWTAGRKIRWEPMREQVPQPPGTHLTAGYGQPSITPQWETCLVRVHDADVARQAYRVLSSGMHPFWGLSMDSLTEVQQRLMDSLAGQKQMSRENWGALLRQVNGMIRQYRDLITHPVRPLWGMVLICGTHLRDGKWRPLLQGGSQDFVPYYVDILGYLAAMPDGTRQMLIGPHPEFETGERVGGRLPYALTIGDARHPGYNMQSMIQQVITSGEGN